MEAKEDLKHPYLEKPLENVMDYWYKWFYNTAYAPLDLIPGFLWFYEFVYLWMPLF